MMIIAQFMKNVPKCLFVLPIILLVSVFTPTYGQTSQGIEKNTFSESQQGKVKTVTIPVKGMSCSSCVSNVKRNVKSMEGVKEVAVSLEKQEATVTYTAGKVSPELLVKTITELGYQAGRPVETTKK